MERDEAGDRPGDPEEGLWGRALPHPEFAVPGDGHDSDVDDDVADDVAAGTSSPLPPEDRLWRHPSELKYTSGGGWGSAWEPVEEAPARTAIYSVAAVTGLLAAAVTAGMFLWLGPVAERVVERTVERQQVPPATITRAVATIGPIGVDVATIAETVRPSITRLDVISDGDDVGGSGSGVIFRDDGHMLTNAHVVAGATDIEIEFADGRRLRGEVIGTDALTDIAVVRPLDIDGRRFVPAVLGTTTHLRVGHTAIAMGSPLRLQGGPTVTVGVVSATGRVLDPPSGSRLFDLVQTDAPIAPGSSGGALLDSNGYVIGITTVIAVSDVGAEGLGFAVPIEIAHDVALDLLTDGFARHGFLGVGGTDLGSDEAAELGLPGGSQVTGVQPGSPAADAGIEVGDILVGLDGVDIASMSQLIVAVRRLEPGDTATIALLRDGEELSVDATVVQLPE